METLQLTNKQVEALLNKNFPNLRTGKNEFGDAIAVYYDGDADSDMKDGLPAFDYWATDRTEKNYTRRVHNELFNFLKDNGLYAECQNPEVWHIYNTY